MSEVKRESPKSQMIGTKKYREMIHKDSKRLDDSGSLPFTFSKPRKSKHETRDRQLVCPCGQVWAIHKNVCGIVCAKCNVYRSVSDSLVLEEENLDGNEPI
jgi:hypothetical protein